MATITSRLNLSLNPLAYSIWGTVEARVCRTPYLPVSALKTAVDTEWANMSEDFIRRVCSGFRPRVEKCIAAEGGHFEK